MVFTEAELFPFSGSTALEAHTALFVIVPAALGCTTIVAEVKLPLPTFPIFVKATTLPVSRYPAGDADTNVTVGGSVLVMVTVVAVAGPRLVTRIVYVRLFPTNTGFGEPTKLMTRSAVGTTTVVATEAVLSSELGSIVEVATVAELVTVPTTFGLTTRERVAPESLMMELIVQVTNPAPFVT